jgi:hypothetical protein
MLCSQGSMLLIMKPSTLKRVERICARIINALAGNLLIRTQLQKRVRTGAIFLNSVRPGWWEKIDVEPGHAAYEAVRMRSIVRGHKNAYRVLHLSPADFVMYGFLPAGSDYGKTTCLPQDVLTQLWKKEIKKWRSLADE